MSQWISVKERLPALREIYKGSPLESEKMLIYNGHLVTVGWYGETYKKRERRWTDATNRVAYVTHWMPLPDPPETSNCSSDVG